MIRKVLIANRGEIAIRIIRACREMGIETVAVYSEEDKDQLHVEMADYAYCVGPAKSTDSYLNMQAIVSVAVSTNCDALHPGYGFLSENPEFVGILEDNGIKFIGPSSSSIKMMGDKAEARKLMMANDVPVTPGSDDEIDDIDEAKRVANEIGYPILIKASRGGGGKGMRRANSEAELREAFFGAKQEAKSAFGEDGVYIEKLILNPKHIEIQVLRDSKGNAVHLGERHCSVQRRNQKMIEEAPYIFMTDELRSEMGQAAINAAEACNYENAGTIEFIMDSNHNYYFMEMNTRLQVEHPVTEMVYDFDIVKEQLRIASGMELSVDQEDIKITGHSIEVRVNSENPAMEFMPSSGVAHYVHGPSGFNVRFDSYLYSGCKVSPYYDSMLGKIIVKGKDRKEAISIMKSAIKEATIKGINSNLDYQYAILCTDEFVGGDYDTGFIENNQDEIMSKIKYIYKRE